MGQGGASSPKLGMDVWSWTVNVLIIVIIVQGMSLWNGKQLRLYVACEGKGWLPLDKWHVLVCIIIDGILKCFEWCECIDYCHYCSRDVTMKRQATQVVCCLWRQRVTSVGQVTCFGLHNYWWDIKMFWMMWMYWLLLLLSKGCHYETASNSGCMLPVKAKGDFRWTSDMFGLHNYWCDIKMLNDVNVLGIVIIVQGVSLWNGKQLVLYVAYELRKWPSIEQKICPSVQIIGAENSKFGSELLLTLSGNKNPKLWTSELKKKKKKKMN